MPETKRTSFRMSDKHKAMIAEIAEFHMGLPMIRVVELAIELLHERILIQKKIMEKNQKRLDVS